MFSSLSPYNFDWMVLSLELTFSRMAFFASLLANSCNPSELATMSEQQLCTCSDAGCYPLTCIASVRLCSNNKLNFCPSPRNDDKMMALRPSWSNSPLHAHVKANIGIVIHLVLGHWQTITQTRGRLDPCVAHLSRRGNRLFSEHVLPCVVAPE